MRSTGGTREDMYPQTTVSGVDPKVTSGLLPGGAGCATAGAIEASARGKAKQHASKPQVRADIRRTFPETGYRAATIAHFGFTHSASSLRKLNFNPNAKSLRVV
jgi:hypothetical protein